MKIAFFDTKPYDKQSFEKYASDDLKFKFFETKLNLDKNKNITQMPVQTDFFDNIVQKQSDK